jgi:hypothetical protein
MLFIPTGRLAVVRVAAPLAFSAETPSTVPPLKKVTVPVGAIGIIDVTAAAKVTDCSKLDGFGEEESATLLLPGCTTDWVTVTVFGWKLLSPE